MANARKTRKSKKVVREKSAKLRNSHGTGKAKGEVKNNTNKDRGVKSKKPKKAESRECFRCKITFDTLHQLKVHRAQVHQGMGSQVCAVCGKTGFDTKTSYSRHMKRHAATITCRFCTRSFSTESQLKEHLRKNVKMEQLVTCTHCSQAFDRACALRHHIEVSHKREIEEKKQWSCSYCGVKFAHKESRRKHEKNKHILTHMKKEKVECSVCGVKVLGLHLHIKRQHPDAVTDTDTIKPSESTHEPGSNHPHRERFQCDICGKQFINSINLREHYAVHAGTALYLCEYCGKSFRVRGNLRTHLRAHTGYRPNQCDRCAKAFVTPEDLRRHMRTHTGEKPFRCEFCAYACRQRAALTAHVRKKHERVE